MANDQNFVTFVTQVSQQTGLDPRVIIAWIKAEGAYAPNGTGGFNYLNLRPAKGGVSYSGVPISVSSGNFEQFSTVQDAITETVNRLHQPFAFGIIANGKGHTPGQTINAIAASGWDSGGYGGGGKNLINDFTSLFSKAALGSAYEGPNLARPIATEVGTTASDFWSGKGGSVAIGAALGTGVVAAGGLADAGIGAGAAKTLAKGAAGVGTAAVILTYFKTYAIRAAEVVGGFFLLLVGLYLLARQVGLNTGTPPGPVGSVV